MPAPMLKDPFPRPPLYAAAAAIVLSLITAAYGRYVGTPSNLPPAAREVASRDLRFEDRADGGVAVMNADDGEMIQLLPPGTNGFVRATLRGFAREHRREDLGSNTPFRVTTWADGRVTLDDLSTGQRVDLEAFGHTNAEAFAHLADSKPAAPGNGT